LSVGLLSCSVMFEEKGRMIGSTGTRLRRSPDRQNT